MSRFAECRAVVVGVVWLAGFVSTSLAGPYLPYTDPAGQVQPDEVLAWATTVVDYSPAPGVGDAFDDAVNALGPNGGGGVSLGDLDASQIAGNVPPGSITLGFSVPIVDKAGPDIAVFENASSFFAAPYIFAELAFVEVSSNGANFARFPASSLNIEPDSDDLLEEDELDAGFGRNFAGLDTTNVRNLAGVHPADIGTPFDLAELASTPEVASGAVDLSAIRYVRLVDIPGDGSFFDKDDNPILDTWLTVGSGGLDLDAVGAINVPEPATSVLVLLGLAAVGLAQLRQKRSIS